eukprot:TRINITY_DN1607_c0_g1_i1.p1 TRINITY_DN1607_c0_g1~~TRINITY_DN1607_c0_g1_i1.p1  ORF type:complete len:217 (+),score=23.43 TRINITY_DN1607_c0_g1_i1:646-1296(+)
MAVASTLNPFGYILCLKLRTGICEVCIGVSAICVLGITRICFSIKEVLNEIIMDRPFVLAPDVVELYFFEDKLGDKDLDGETVECLKSICEALKVNNTLTKLRLSGKKLSDESSRLISEALKVNKSLKDLDLSNNRILDEGLKSICEALKVNNNLTSIDLSCIAFENESPRFICEALKVNNTLTSLNLISNHIGVEGSRFICEALKVNKSLKSISL